MPEDLTDKKGTLWAELSEPQQQTALSRYHSIEPLLTFPSPPARQAMAQEAGVTERTIQRWLRAYKNDGLSGLVTKTRSDSGKNRGLSEDWLKLIQGVYLEMPKRSVKAVHRKIIELARQHGFKTPSYQTVRTICQKIPKPAVCLAKDGLKAYRHQYEPIIRYEPTRPNEFWECDHCLLDLFVLDSAGQPGRPWLTAILDKFSRALMGYYLSTESPSSLHTSLALRQAIWHKSRSGWPMCGLADKLHVDNGADLVSEHMKQAALNLKIELIAATPGLPRARGRIERFFYTVNQQFLCELPGYIGNDYKNRPETITPKLTLAELEDQFVGYILDRYHQTPHEPTGETPHDRWNKNFIPRLPASLHELDLLLVHVTQRRKVRRDGIHFLNLRYFSENLVPFIGEEVAIKYDPRDLAVIHVYHHGKLVGKAFEPELSPVKMSLREVQALQKRRRRELRKEIQEKVSFSKRYLAQLQQGASESLKSEENVTKVKGQRAATDLKLYDCD